MRYLDSYRALFKSPNWAMNLLFLTVCVLIPILGPLVMMGYLLEVVIHKHRHGDEGPYPDFNFDRFMPYLTRGLWPFLVTLVVGVVVALVTVFLIFTLMCCLGVIGAPDALLTLLSVVIASCVFVLSVALQIVVVPMILRAGLQQELAPAFDRQYLREFFRLVGKETVLAVLFYVVSSLVVTTAGLCLLCVGMYPAAALSYFALFHLEFQLYELYLSRGGQPIEIQEPEELTPPGTSAPPPPADGAAPPPLH